MKSGIFLRVGLDGPNQLDSAEQITVCAQAIFRFFGQCLPGELSEKFRDDLQSVPWRSWRPLSAPPRPSSARATPAGMRMMRMTFPTSGCRRPRGQLALGPRERFTFREHEGRGYWHGGKWVTW
jgi:hypothetical protein